MSKLTIVHISDAHWSDSKQDSENGIVEALLADLSELSERRIIPDAVIFSGDLVQAGEQSDVFARATVAVFDPILSHLSLQRDRLFVCPGNHDISRAVAREQSVIEDGLKSRLKSQDALLEFIKRAQSGAQVEGLALQRLGNFYQWYDNEFESSHKAGNFYRLRKFEIDGRTIGIALFNTAWRATGESGNVDERNLILGSIFVEKASECLDDCAYRVAVLHHPFENLIEFDRDYVEPRLTKNFDLICTGHTHKPKPEGVIDSNGSSIRSQAGSLYAGSRWFNGYQVIEIDFVADTTTIFCREYFALRGQFGPAANLINADPACFPFAAKDRSATDLVAQFLETNREIIRERLLEHLDFAKEGAIGRERLQQSFACPKLYRKSVSELDGAGGVSESFSKVRLEDLLDGDEDVLFYGPRQTGKTSLKLYIADRVSQGIEIARRIPIIIDPRDFTFNLYGVGKVLREIYAIPARFELERAVKEGHFVFLIEDIGQLTEAGLERVAKFIEAFKPNRFFVFGCPDANSVAKERHFKKALPKLAAVGIGGLTRGAIRQMTRNWFDDREEANAKFELVVGQLNRDGLPRTAYMVGLLLWAAKKGQDGDRLNEAILLQKVLDHLLDRADFQSAKRGVLHTRGKELLLIYLANQFDQRDGLVKIADVISWTDNYFDQKKLGFDPVSVIEELAKCGILRRENGHVGFRYKCFQEYFTALGMTNANEMIAKVEGTKFLERPREIELLSGLQSENDWLIENVLRVMEERMPRDLAGTLYSDFEQECYGTERHFITRDKLRKIRKTRLSEEQIDNVMDALDERATSKGDQPLSESLDEAEGDFVRAAQLRQNQAIRKDLDDDAQYFRPGTYIAALSILARLIRNSDFTDYAVKGPALHRLLEEWCRIHTLLTRDVRWILREFEKHEEDPLDEEEFETLVRIMSKLLFGVTSTTLLNDVSTPALIETLNELEKEGGLVSGKRLIGLMMREDMDDPTWPDRWKTLIEDRKSPPFDVDILIDRLWRSVNRKAADEVQDRRVGKVVDAVEKRFDWSNSEKSNVLADIRQLSQIKRAGEN